MTKKYPRALTAEEVAILANCDLYDNQYLSEGSCLENIPESKDQPNSTFDVLPSKGKLKH